MVQNSDIVYCLCSIFLAEYVCQPSQYKDAQYLIDDIFGHTVYFYAVYLNINWETLSLIPPMTKHQGVICNTAAAIRGNISYMQRISPPFLQHINTKRFGLYIRNKSDHILKQNTLIFIKAESVSVLGVCDIIRSSRRNNVARRH